MKAEAMFISRPESDHAEISGDPGLGEISGGRLAEPHDFPWYLLIPVLNKNFLSILRQFPTDYLPCLGLPEALYVMMNHYRNFSILNSA